MDIIGEAVIELNRQIEKLTSNKLHIYHSFNQIPIKWIVAANFQSDFLANFTSFLYSIHSCCVQHFVYQRNVIFQLLLNGNVRRKKKPILYVLRHTENSTRRNKRAFPKPLHTYALRRKHFSVNVDNIDFGWFQAITLSISDFFFAIRQIEYLFATF